MSALPLFDIVLAARRGQGPSSPENTERLARLTERLIRSALVELQQIEALDACLAAPDVSAFDEQAATLLDMPVRSYRRWKAEGPGRVSRDGAARLSNLMGIHKALRIVFSEAQRGYAWIKAGHSALAGSSALEVMLGGELTDIMRVRRYLDAERGGW